MSIKQYYEKELSALYHEANLFSKRYPEHAAALNLEKNKSQDPHVQRLLEGCAFLTAKIHQCIEEESDRIPEQLIQCLWPQLSESFPSVSMVQARPNSSMPKSIPLPKGTVLKSPILGEEKTSSTFITTHPMTVSSIILHELKHHKDEEERLMLSFKAGEKQGWDQITLDELPLYIDTKFSKALTIVTLLISEQTRIVLKADGHRIDAGQIQFDFPALNPEHCLIDQQSSGLCPQQLMFEAFAFPEKLQWIVLKGLSTLKLPTKMEILTIELSHPNPFDHSHEITFEDFKLFTVPAINRFEQDCEPITLDHKRYRYALTADHHRPASAQVVSVLQVRGLAEINQPQHNFQPLHQIIHPEQAYYSYHSPGTLSFNSDTHKTMSISVKAMVCNGHYPRRYLRPQSLFLAEHIHDPYLTLTNLHQPSPYLAADKRNLNDQLLKLLRVQIEDVNTVDHLKLLLVLMNRSENPGLLQKIEALSYLKVTKHALVRKGVFHQVHGLEIHLEEKAFISPADITVFGMLLHAYFQSSAGITTLIETTLILNPSEERFKWLGRF